MKEFKKLSELFISEKIENRYFQPARRLQCLAITKFSNYIEEIGGKILSCSIVRDANGIKRNPIIEGWMKFTFDMNIVYYIQFDRNPFFPHYGYREYYTDSKKDIPDKYKEKIKTKIVRASTGMIDYSDILYKGINGYDDSSANVEALFKNIISTYEKISVEKYIFFDESYDYRDKIEQKIYYK